MAAADRAEGGQVGPVLGGVNFGILGLLVRLYLFSQDISILELNGSFYHVRYYGFCLFDLLTAKQEQVLRLYPNTIISCYLLTEIEFGKIIFVE